MLGICGHTTRNRIPTVSTSVTFLSPESIVNILIVTARTWRLNKRHIMVLLFVLTQQKLNQSIALCLIRYFCFWPVRFTAESLLTIRKTDCYSIRRNALVWCYPDICRVLYVTLPLLDYLWRYLLWRHLVSVKRCVNEQSTVVQEVLSIGEVAKH